jgi:hypothetical protein
MEFFNIHGKRRPVETLEIHAEDEKGNPIYGRKGEKDLALDSGHKDEIDAFVKYAKTHVQNSAALFMTIHKMNQFTKASVEKAKLIAATEQIFSDAFKKIVNNNTGTLIGLTMINLTLSQLVAAGMNKEVLLSSVQDKLIAEFKKSIKDSHGSTTGKIRVDQMQDQLIKLGIDSALLTH